MSSLLPDLAVVFYDYVITFTREVQFMWGSRMTYALLIFYLNRCNMVVLVVTNVLWLFPMVATVELVTDLMYLFR
ncbi:hypothetical protein AcV5_003186 [Taiwanofungus camphoratus]|nr:hypothetical protein AcV5_003186 [Antrodia cinnamomea]